MSKESTGITKRPLSSEGTEKDKYPANLEQQLRPRHNHPQHETIPKDEGGSKWAETVGGGATQSSQSEPHPHPSTMTSSSEGVLGERSEGDQTPRQVIAVSASKSPAAFFNLARRFLVSNEMCDLSALEGAIVSAVDAAHLLERSKLATIVR